MSQAIKINMTLEQPILKRQQRRHSPFIWSVSSQLAIQVKTEKTALEILDSEGQGINFRRSFTLNQIMPEHLSYIVLAYESQTDLELYDKGTRNKETTLAAVQRNGLALQHANEEFRNDKDIVLAAVQQNGEAIRYAYEELRNDRDIAQTAVERNLSALQYVSREFVLAAVRINGLALRYANDELRNDLEVVLAAVQQDGRAIQYANEELRNNPEIVLALHREQSELLQFARTLI